MTEPPPQLRVIDRLASLALVLEWALGLRIVAANVVQWYTQLKGALCVFPDTTIYWLLAGTIRDGAPYEVLERGDLPHFSLRTPGYPLFLALCRMVFGDCLLAVRLVQAGLGTLSVWLVFRLTERVARRSRRVVRVDDATGGGGSRGVRPVLRGDLGADPVRGGVRPADAGEPLGPGGALVEGRRGVAAPARMGLGVADGRRVGRGGAGSAVVGARRAGDAAGLDRRERPGAARRRRGGRRWSCSEWRS